MHDASAPPSIASSGRVTPAFNLLPHASRSSLMSMESAEHGRDALRVLHYVFPAVLLTYYIVSQIVSICTLQNLQSRGCKIKRRPIVLLQCTVLILYTVEALLLVLDSLLSNPSNSSTDGNVSPICTSYSALDLFVTLIIHGFGRSMPSFKLSYGLFLLPQSSSQGTASYGIHYTDPGSSPS